MVKAEREALEIEEQRAFNAWLNNENDDIEQELFDKWTELRRKRWA